MFDLYTLASPTFGNIALLTVIGSGLSWVIAVFSFWAVNWMFEKSDIPFITGVLYKLLNVVIFIRNALAAVFIIAAVCFLAAVAFSVFSLIVLAVNGG